LQATPQVPLLHVATPLAAPGHGTHPLPHDAGESSAKHTPEQSCEPGAQAQECAVKSQTSFAPHWALSAHPGWHCLLEMSQYDSPTHGVFVQSSIVRQVPLAHTSPASQATPQFPQFNGSSSRLVQLPAHSCSPLGQLGVLPA
jgi:hypothetical protein